MRFLRKIFSLLVISLLAILVVLVFANYYLAAFWHNPQADRLGWMITYADFSTKYIFWAKTFLQSNESYQYPEEAFLAQKIIKHGPCEQTSKSKKFLFIGDSFTVGPWTKNEDVYSAVFLEQLATKTNTCITEMKLASHSTGTHQQLARLMDTIDQLRPDEVIWQFCENDIYENDVYELFSINDNQELERIYPWNNLVLWMGKANQIIPDTSLGRFLLYSSLSQEFFKHYDKKSAEKELKYSLITKKIDELATQYNFTWHSILVPMECKFIGIDCPYGDDNFSELETLLKNHTPYISIIPTDEEVEIATTLFGTSKEQLFNTTDDPAVPGMRHFSKLGNKFFGNILLTKYLVATQN